ncbi:MAG: polysaccharide biosynthesis tyrosine autokinase [Chlorobiota bacterium]
MPTPARQRNTYQRNGLANISLQRHFTLVDYLHLLWQGKWWILSITGVVVAAAFYYTWTRPFVYEASARLLVNTSRPPTGIVLVGLAGQDERMLRNELMQMNAHETMQAVAEALLQKARAGHRLSITTFAKPNSPSPRSWEDSVAAVASRIRSVVSLIPTRDADIVDIRVRTNEPTEAALIANTFAEVYVQVNERNNRANARRVREFLQQQYEWTRDTLAKAEQMLQDYMSRTGAMELDARANALVTQLSELDGKASEARIARDALKQALEQYQQQLREIEPRLAEELATVSSPYIETLQQQIAQLEVQRDLIVASKPLVASPVYFQTQMQQLEEQLAELKEKLRQRTEELKRSKLGTLPASPEGGGPTAALQHLRQKVFELSVQLQAEEARLKATEQARQRAEAEFRQLPAQSIELARLRRITGGLEKLHELLSEKLNEAIIAEQSVFATVSILEKAVPPKRPISPNRSLNMMIATIVGLLLGIGFVLIRVLSDTTIRSPEDLESKGLVVLAAIPRIPPELTAQDAAMIAQTEEDVTFYSRFPAEQVVPPHLITHYSPKSPIAESYRSVRTALQFATVDTPHPLVVVTSSVPQEGKTTTSVNTAITFAQAGYRTLLIDADLRRPSAHNIFGFGREPGLVNVLIGDLPVDQACRPTGIKNLDILTCGPIPPNPSELLGSERTRQLFQQLRQQYDIVLVDTPPVISVTDALVLAPLAHAYLLVARANETKIDALLKAQELLERVSARIIGVVLNEFDISTTYGSYYRYYRYYKYYHYYTDSEKRRSTLRSSVK